jgi:hypothetical protein
MDEELYALFDFPYTCTSLVILKKGNTIMNKVLIAIGVILSAYLIYTSVSSDDKNEVDLEAVAKVETVVTKSNDEIVDNYADSDNDTEYLDGKYSLYYVTEMAETDQVYTFSEDKTFELTREIVVPASHNNEQVSKGTYEIVKNEVVLKFEKERNRKYFPEDVIELKMLKDGNLEYDTLIVKKEYF